MGKMRLDKFPILNKYSLFLFEIFLMTSIIYALYFKNLLMKKFNVVFLILNLSIRKGVCKCDG